MADTIIPRPSKAAKPFLGSREEARLIGAVRYIDGTPCGRNHAPTVRLTSNKQCVDCRDLKSRELLEERKSPRPHGFLAGLIMDGQAVYGGTKAIGRPRACRIWATLVLYGNGRSTRSWRKSRELALPLRLPRLDGPTAARRDLRSTGDRRMRAVQQMALSHQTILAEGWSHAPKGRETMIDFLVDLLIGCLALAAIVWHVHRSTRCISPERYQTVRNGQMSAKDLKKWERESFLSAATRFGDAKAVERIRQDLGQP